MDRAGVVLEMTDPAELVGVRTPRRLELREIPSSDAPRIGALYRRIWAPIGGGGRSEWSDARWIAELEEGDHRGWLAAAGDEDIGMAELGWSGDGDAAFVVIGIVPEHQGRGRGGELLERLTRLMWETPARSGAPTNRVWVWTVPGEHPHTIPNYLARGFRSAPA